MNRRNIILIFNLIVLFVIACALVFLDHSTDKNEASLLESQVVERVILERRSIRLYEARPVESAKVTQILQAGMAAPSSRDRRPVHLMVLDDSVLLQRLGDTLANASMLSNAPLAIVVLGDSLVSDNCWMLDGSASIQNMLLMAHALDLGAVWTAAYPYPDRELKIVSILEIPEPYRVLAIIPIGYPAESPSFKEKYDSTHVHYNFIKK